MTLRLKFSERPARPAMAIVPVVENAPARPALAAPAPMPIASELQDVAEERQPFARWLVGQKDRSGWIGTLAGAARKDPAFPKNGSPDDVRRRLSEMGAEGDMFEAVDDAESDWLSI